MKNDFLNIFSFCDTTYSLDLQPHNNLPPPKKNTNICRIICMQIEGNYHKKAPTRAEVQLEVRDIHTIFGHAHLEHLVSGP